MDIAARAMNHFHIKHLHIDTLGEHVIFIHEGAVTAGNLGFRPLDRVHVVGEHPVTHSRHEVIGVLNFCGDALVAPNEIGLSEMAFHDLGLPGGTAVAATIALAPRSVDLVRNKLYGHRLDGDAYTSILTDVAAHRYSKVELSMFVLACALRPLDLDELVHFTRAMIASGTSI